MARGATILLVLLMAADARAAGPRVQLETIDRNTIRGTLVGINAEGRIKVETEEGVKEVGVEDVGALAVSGGDKGESADRPDERECLFYLNDGGMLAGRMVDAPSDAAPRTLAVDIGLDQPIALPMAALAAVRFTSLPNEQAERELKARMAQREAARDLLIVPQAEKVVVLPGALERLTPKEWEFRFQTRSQTAALDRAYGVVFGAGVGSAARLPAKVHLRSDNTFGARLVEADDALLTLDAGQMGKLSVPWAAVRRIDLQSGRVTYVSDLKPSQTDVRPFLAAEWPPQKDRSVGGGPLSMRGEVFKKGLGVHATTALSFDIGAEFESFQAVVGIDDVVRPHGTAVFRVLGDGRELFRADDVSGGDEPRRIVVDVSGVKTLTLECSAGQELDLSDHCDWAEARLIRRAGGKAGRGT